MKTRKSIWISYLFFFFSSFIAQVSRAANCPDIFSHRQVFYLSSDEGKVKVVLKEGIYDFSALKDPYFKSDYFDRNKIKETFQKFCKFKSKYQNKPFYKDLMAALAKKVGERKTNTLARALPCLAHFPLHYLKESQGNYRDQTKEDTERDYWSLHGSNWGITLNSMSALQCVLSGPGFARIFRSNEKQALVISIVGSVLGNTWEEIRLPFLEEQKSMPLFADHEVVTDTEDFQAGIAATASYAVGMSLMQHYLSKNPQLIKLLTPTCK